MSKLKRSRALRRNLRKQARKGTLSARERKTLLQQEKRFRKARRPLMKGLGFGAGLGAGAAAFLGAGGIAQALAQGLISRGEAKRMMEDQQEDQDDQERGTQEQEERSQENYSDQQDQGEIMEDELGRNPNALFYDVEEQPSNQVVGGPGAVEDVVVVGEGEEAPAEERQATAEDRARAERAAQRAERAREAGVDASLEAGLGGPDRPYTDYGDPEGMGATRATESSQAGKLMSALAEMEGPSVNRLMSDLEEMEGPGAVGELLSDLSPGRFEELRGALPVAPDRMQTRPAQQLSVDRPDPRMDTVFDPRLPKALGLEPLSDMDRLDMIRRRMAQGGRLDKSNDLVARIKRKYGLR